MAGWGTASPLDVSVGVALLVAGAAAWRLRAGDRTGALVAATGACWLLGDLTAAAIFLHRGPLVHVVLGYPAGRLRSRPARAVALASYLTAAVLPLGRSEPISMLLAAALVYVVGLGFVRSRGSERRAQAVALAAATLTAAALAIGPVTRLASLAAPGTVLAIYDALVLLASGVLLLDVARKPWAETAASGLVVDLGEAADTSGLRDRLARAVGDPTLVLGYWLSADKRYVDERGRSVELPGAGDVEAEARVVTPVSNQDQPLAVLVHDIHVLGDPALLADVVAATQLAVANARLQAQVRAQLASVESSRRRLLTAADDERRLLEAELRDGVERHLARVEELIAGASVPLRALEVDIRRALSTLGDLSLGLHPPAVAAGDLSGALAALAARAPVRVQMHAPEVLLPPPVVTAAYFVCAEAITNVAKYAGVGSATVRATIDDRTLELVVSDQGEGGADPAAGTGLRGLVDRAEALGGTLTVDSPPGRGTVLTLRLPADDRPVVSAWQAAPRPTVVGVSP